MERTDNMPMWVFLAFASIATRKGALILIWVSVIFSVYCIPWALFFSGQVWVGKIFLIEDWSWLAMMVPIVLWYWMSLRWMDNNPGWEVARQDEE